MQQIQELTIESLEDLIKVAKELGRPIEVDWINRHIRVLSDTRVRQTRTGKLYAFQSVIASAEIK